MYDDPYHFPPALLQLIGRRSIIDLDPAGGAMAVLFEGRPEHAHSGGAMIQGGIVTAWLDHAMAVAVAAMQQAVAVASLEIKVSFLAPVRVGPVLAEARVIKLGRSIAFMEGRLLTPDRADVLATASSSGKLIRLGQAA
jgi:uncharacterized protein (TIGR00369 family)